MDAVVTLPEIGVAVDGQALSAACQQALGEIMVSQQLSRPSQCELVFHDLPVESDLDTLMPGSTLIVTVTQERRRLFAGEVTAVNDRYGADRGRELRVRCYDRLHRLRKRQPVRAHADQTLAALAGSLVADIGITVQGEDDGPMLRWLVQHRQSDLELLRTLAERGGYYFYLHDDVLRLMTLEGMEYPAQELVLGDSLLEAGVEVNSDRACRGVDVHAWDPWEAAPRPGHATAARSGRRVAATAEPERVGGEPVRSLAGRTLQDTVQADALAQAELDRRHANEVVLAGVAAGDPALHPGRVVQVSGLAAAVNGRYVLTAARHRIDRRRGYLTEIDTSVAESTTSSDQGGMTIGLVTDVDDPQGLGRVRVSLPGFADTDSLWLQVLLPGAGKDKGLVALPDTGDRVLVMFADDDPAQGVVLGGLYGEVTPPDEAGVASGAVERFLFRTPGGQRLTLDDGRRRVTVKNDNGEFLELAPDRLRAGNSDGSFIELSSERVRLHAEVDLEIDAPGRSITIRGKSIDFESA